MTWVNIGCGVLYEFININKIFDNNPSMAMDTIDQHSNMGFAQLGTQNEDNLMLSQDQPRPYNIYLGL